MKIIKSISEIRKEITKQKCNNKTIGFVPTMGTLHEGHLSLVKESVNNNDITVVSIFINPLQFGPNEDFNKYPRNLNEDSKLLQDFKTDYIFAPETETIYDTQPSVQINIPELFNILCGRKRIGHFSGVCIVVTKLLNIIQANNIYMGKKDYQQLIIIKKLVKDLSINSKIIAVPILRDKDGLALSSRNLYLSKSERLNALAINKSRAIIKKLYKKSYTVKKIEKEIYDVLTKNNLEVEYVEIRESTTLKKTEKLNEASRIFIAAYSGKTRLIDNYTIKECLLFL